MKTFRTKAKFKAVLNSAVSQLAIAGVEKPDWIHDQLESSWLRHPDGAMGYQTEPLVNFILWLTESIDKKGEKPKARTEAIADNPQLRESICRTLESIRYQLLIATISDDFDSIRDVFLLARRRTVADSCQTERLSIPEEFAAYGLELYLPDESSQLGELTPKPQSLTYIEEQQEQMARFVGLIPMTASHGSANPQGEFDDAATDSQAAIFFREDSTGVRLDFHLNGKKRRRLPNRLFALEAATTAALARSAVVEPLGYLILDWAQEPGKAEKYWKCLLIFYLAVFHQISDRHVGSLGLQKKGMLGQLTRTHLVLKIGSPYFKQGLSCYDPSELEIPLCPEIRSLLKFADQNFFSFSTVGEALGHHHSRKYASWVKALSRRHLKVYPPGRAFDRIGQGIAIHELGVSSTIPGLVSANPLLGTRGPAAYVAEVGEALCRSSLLIASGIRENAGLPAANPEALPGNGSKIVHGSRTPGCREYWQSLRRNVEAAEDHNAILACVESFIRGLGPRNMKDAVNPIVHYAPLPHPSFLFMDKIVAGARSRNIPISAAIARLVETCASLFGSHQLLPFISSGKVIPYSKLPTKAPCRRILEFSDLKQPGRTVFYNALRRAGAGELILDGAMAHGASVFQPGAPLYPLGLDEQFELLREVIFKLYEEFQIDNLASILEVKLRRLVDREAIAEAPPLLFPSSKPPRRVGDLTEIQPTGGTFVFPTSAEIFRCLPLEGSGQFQTTPDKRRKSEIPSILEGLPLTPHGLLLTICLDLGIPVRNLVRLLRYYKAGNFLLDHTSGNIYFLAFAEHDDAGGLSALPLFLCHESAKENNRVWCLFRHLLPDGHPSDRLFSEYIRNTAREKKGSSREIQRYLGSCFSRLVRQGKHRSTLKPEDCFSLLEKWSQFACLRKYPSPVFYALAKGSRYGLNHVAVEDVVEGMTGKRPILTYASDGSAYHLESGPQKRADKIPAETLEKLAMEKDNVTKREKVRALFRKHKVVASRKGFKKILEKMGYTEDASPGMIRELNTFYRTEGLLEVSKPERILLEYDQDCLVKKIAREKEKDESFIALLCLMTSARISEICNLRLFHNKSITTAYISKGKSRNSKRWISLNMVCSKDLIDLLWEIWDSMPVAPGEVDVRTFSRWATPAENSERLINFLAGIGYDHLTAHSLRRQFVARNVRKIMKDVRINNSVAALCHLALACGHGSFGVSLRDYIGTYILAINSLREARHKEDVSAQEVSREQRERLNQLAFAHAFGTPFRAEKQLTSELRGDAVYQTSLEASYREAEGVITRGFSGQSKIVRLTEKPPVVRMRETEVFECTLKKPAPHQVGRWEKVALRIITLALKRERSVTLQNFSSNPSFLQEVTNLAQQHGGSLENSA
jgi:integrase